MNTYLQKFCGLLLIIRHQIYLLGILITQAAILVTEIKSPALPLRRFRAICYSFVIGGLKSCDAIFPTRGLL